MSMERLHFILNAESHLYLYGLATAVITFLIFSNALRRSDVSAADKFIHPGNLQKFSLTKSLPLVPMECYCPTLECSDILHLPDRWCRKVMIRCERSTLLCHIVDLEAGIVGPVQRSSFQGTQIQKVVSCCEQLYAHRGA